MEDPDLDQNDSLMGFSVQKDPTASCTAYFIYLWDSTTCSSAKMPHAFQPSLACVGNGTMWDQEPISSEIFERGSGEYKVGDFYHTSDISDYWVMKRLDMNTYYPFNIQGGSASSGLSYSASLINASITPLPSDFTLPDSCSPAKASNLLKC